MSVNLNLRERRSRLRLMSGWSDVLKRAALSESYQYILPGMDREENSLHINSISRCSKGGVERNSLSKGST
jgi:hypothetical protein